MNKKLIKESIKEFGISYDTKTILEDIQHEEPLFLQEEYWIPERYNETKLVFLPVDPHWHFVYWDIKDTLYEKIKSYTLQFRVVCCGEEKLSINILQQYGSYYFNFHAPFKDVYCILGYVKNNEFVEIARSNIFKLPSDQIFEGEEIFVTKETLKNKEIGEKLKKKIYSSQISQEGTKEIQENIIGSSDILK